MAPQTTCETRVTHPQSPRDQVDLLFVVDNSASMSPMAEELRARFPGLLKVFSDLAGRGTYADLHLGVITTDYGAGRTGAPGCQPSPGGQLGRLVDIGASAPPSCKAPAGARFVRHSFRPGGPSNLPRGQDLAATFTCMASVVSAQHAGCGFEHVLESARAALQQGAAENAGFLRDDALLAVVFVTNEDDCSAPPDSDLFDKSRRDYGYLSSYRCTRYGIVCDGGPGYDASKGPLANCRPAPSGPLFGAERYTDFFARLKRSPEDLILVALDGPSAPVQVNLNNPGSPGIPDTCGTLNEQSSPPCVPALQHACVNHRRPTFFADPAVRLNAVVAATRQHQVSSICDDDFSGALAGVGQLIASSLRPGCLGAPLEDPTSPDCVVEEVSRDGAAPVARCATGAPLPCWRLEARPECTGSGGAAIAIDRAGSAPIGATARITCRTVCS